MRFQVVLTAFQTLGENEGLNLNAPVQPAQQPGAANPFASPPPPLQPTGGGDNLNQNAQFICDSQRLISADLACDGYKNCQDGHDEDLAICASANQERGAHKQQPAGSKSAPTPPDRTQQLQTRDNESGVLVRALKTLHTALDGSSLAGFLLGFLLVLLLLCCCSCCLYCCLVLWRRHLAPVLHEAREQARGSSLAAARRRKRQQLAEAQLAEAAGGGGSSSLLLSQAERQNEENAARLRALSGRDEATNEQQRRLQSILKKAPLARFETVRAGDESAAGLGQPAAPAPPPRRGALASSLTGATGKRRFVAPTPAQRRSRQLAAEQERRAAPPPTSSAVLVSPNAQPGADSTLRVPPLPVQSPAQTASTGPSSGQTLSFTTRATRVEHSTSTSRRALEGGGGERRVSEYVYSEDTARYTESYLVSRGSAAPSAARDYVNLRPSPSGGGGGEQQRAGESAESQQKPRQSSLI